jgi:hypothetical protein
MSNQSQSVPTGSKCHFGTCWNDLVLTVVWQLLETTGNDWKLLVNMYTGARGLYARARGIYVWACI